MENKTVGKKIYAMNKLELGAWKVGGREHNKSLNFTQMCDFQKSPTPKLPGPHPSLWLLQDCKLILEKWFLSFSWMKTYTPQALYARGYLTRHKEVT